MEQKHFDCPKEKPTSKRESQSTSPKKESLVLKRSTPEETEASMSAGSKKPKFEEEKLLSKSDLTSDTDYYIDMKDWVDTIKAKTLEIVESCQKTYKPLCNKFYESKPFCPIEDMYIMQSDILKLNKQIKGFESIEAIHGIAGIQEDCRKLRKNIHDLQNDLYKMTMDFKIKFADYYNRFKYYDTLSGNSQLAQRMAEIRQTPLYQELKQAREQFEESYARAYKVFEQFSSKKDERVFRLDDTLVQDYKSYCRALDNVSNYLHTRDVNQELIEQGKKMPEHIQDNLKKRREGGMSEQMLELQSKLFYYSAINKLSRCPRKSETFDPLMRLGVIEGNEEDYYSITTFSTLPVAKIFSTKDKPLPLKIAVNPKLGIIVHHQADREADGKWRKNHFLEHLTKETWLDTLKEHQWTRNNAWFEYIHTLLEPQTDFPDGAAIKEVTAYIDTLLETKKEPGLKYIKNLLDPEKYLLKKNSLESIEAALELKEELWFNKIMHTLKLKDGIPEVLSQKNWDQYTSKLSDLKKDLSEEPSIEAIEKHFMLLKETWFEHIKDNLTVTKEMSEYDFSKEYVLQYAANSLDTLKEQFEKILKFKADFQNNLTKETLLAFVKKTSELDKPFPKGLPQEAWDQYIEKNKLAYDKLPKDFFESPYISEFTERAIELANAKYKADTGQAAAPLRQLIGVGFANPRTVEALYGLGKPGEMIIYTPEDKDYYRLYQAHYTSRAEYMNMKIEKIGLYMFHSGEKCLTLYIDPRSSSPDTE